jgi:hypothetical protein
MKRLMFAVLAMASLFAVPVMAQDAPPCGTKDKPTWCLSADTGFDTVVTRNEKHEYATGGLQVQGPIGHTGLKLHLRGELMGVQDGGRLNFANAQSFRAVTVEGALFKTLGAKSQFALSARGATTLSVEGGIAAPIDSRLWTGQVEATARLKAIVVTVRGGHDGTVGGWAFGGGLAVPIPNAPDIVTNYSYPLSRVNPTAPVPWVATAGAKLTFGTWSLANLFN